MKRGFTFVEVMISVGITSIMVMAILGLMRLTDNYWNQDSGLADLQQEVRQGMDRMAKEIRQASRSSVNVTSGNTRIDFVIPINISTSPTTYSSDTAYYLNNVSGQVTRAYGNASSGVVSSNITSLSFCCDNGAGTCGSNCTNVKLIRIDLRAGKTVHQQQLFYPVQGNYTERVELRNN